MKLKPALGAFMSSNQEMGRACSTASGEPKMSTG